MEKKKNSNPIDLNINLKLSLKPILNKKFALNAPTAYGYYLLIDEIISAYTFFFFFSLLDCHYLKQQSRLNFCRLPGSVLDKSWILPGGECGLIFPNSGW